MGRYEASSSLCIAAVHIEEDPSLSLRMTLFIEHSLLAAIA
ncbi:hypothetical protein [Mucilaginibacter sp.]